MEFSSDRRVDASRAVGFDTSGSVLAVGARTAVLDDVPVVDLTAAGPATKKRRLQPLSLAVGVLSIAGAIALARMATDPNSTPAATLVPAETQTTLVGAGTVRVEADPNGTGRIVIAESASAPSAADGTEIGSPVLIFREP